MALSLCVVTACKDKPDAAKTQPATVDLDKRCVQLGKICGDKGKHVDKIVNECKQVGKKQVESGCAEKVFAVYDCYEREVCGNSDKVWTIDDIRLLADRHGKCVAEQAASRECTEK